jgi:hypothetical protein
MHMLSPSWSSSESSNQDLLMKEPGAAMTAGTLCCKQVTAMHSALRAPESMKRIYAKDSECDECDICGR